MSYVKCCEQCAKTPKDDLHNGYYPFIRNDIYICPICKSNLTDTIITKDEYLTFCKISSDNSFIQAMIKLKQDDIIEYQSRMSQFRSQIEQQKAVEQKQQQNNVPKCPTCSSTDLKKISTTSKVMNTAIWGIFGTKRHKTYHCNSCGYEW